MKLVVLNEDLAGTEFELVGSDISIGRRSDNDLCLPMDKKISRQHARLFHRGGELLLEDQASANGTFLWQRRIYAPTPLHEGDKFRLGRTWLELTAVDEPSPDTAAAQQVVLVGEDAVPRDAATDRPAASNIVFAVDAATPGVPQGEDEDAQNRLAVLLDFGQALGSILEIPKLVRVALDRIMNAVPAEQASLLLVSRETGEVEPQLVRSRPREGVEQPSGLRLRISKNIVTQALEQRLAILTTDATTDARFLDADSVHDLKIRSAICAPMVAHGQPVGVIYLDTSSRTHVFSQNDVHLVTGIASQTAIAVENARLYTDLRSAYEELQAAQESMVASERVTTVGMLAASIAHDMANIVSPLKPLLDLLLSGEEVDSAAEDVLRRQTERLIALVQRLLAFSRASEIDLKPTDINEIVENTLSLVTTELAHRRVHLDRSLGEDLPLACVDSAQMERALLNLILNAAEALEQVGDRQIWISTEVEDTDLLINVKDSGPGIPEDVQQRLFEPFFTTKKAGTGLGLYSCRRIVEEEHEGSLEVDSRPGAGTTITIRLPVYSASREREPAGASAAM